MLAAIHGTEGTRTHELQLMTDRQNIQSFQTTMLASHKRGFKSRIINWLVHPDGLIDPNTLLKDRVNAANPSLEFFALLITSSVIATIGLVDNSAAVVIGAMVIAPLMDPIISLAFAIANRNIRLAIQSLSLITLGIVIVVVVSSLVYKSLNVDYIDAQIISRVFPNLTDLVIAVAAGAAGAFAHSRLKLAGSLAGVAIAVALVPPLCVTGIGMQLSAQASVRFGNAIIPSLSHDIPQGSFLLFITNLLGITGASIIVFLAQRNGSLQKCWSLALAWMLLLALVCLPLSSSFQHFTISQNVQEDFQNYRLTQLGKNASRSDHSMFWSNTRVLYCHAKTLKDSVEVSLVLLALIDPSTDSILSAAFSNLIKKNIEPKITNNHEIKTRISVVPNTVYNLDSSPNPKQ